MEIIYDTLHQFIIRRLPPNAMFLEEDKNVLNFIIIIIFFFVDVKHKGNRAITIK